jgi:hypothetical protein
MFDLGHVEATDEQSGSGDRFEIAGAMRNGSSPNELHAPTGLPWPITTPPRHPSC